MQSMHPSLQPSPKHASFLLVGILTLEHASHELMQCPLLGFWMTIDSVSIEYFIVEIIKNLNRLLARSLSTCLPLSIKYLFYFLPTAVNPAPWGFGVLG